MLHGVWDKINSLLRANVSVSQLKTTHVPRLFIYWTKVSPLLLDFLKDDFHLEEALRLVSLSELVKLRKMPLELLAKSLLSKLLVTLIINYFREAPMDENVPFKYTEHGKPTLADDNLQFSISTSNRIVCIAVEIGSGLPIGVDLSHSEQDAISSVNFMTQFEPMFSASEKIQLEAVSDLTKRYIAFNHLWTLKEAFTKLIGSGLNVDLAQFSFQFQTVGINWSRSTVDANGLSHSPFLQALNKEDFFCYSKVLDDSSELPILVSFITQERNNRPKSFFIDFTLVFIT